MYNSDYEVNAETRERKTSILNSKERHSTPKEASDCFADLSPE